MKKTDFAAHKKSTNVRVLKAGRRVTHALLRLFWLWAPGITRWLCFRLFFSPMAYSTSTEEEACLRRGRPFQLQVQNDTIKGWMWGRGPSVLLVHGWSGRGIQFHRFVAPLVKAGYTAVAIDGPAHGASSGRISSYFQFTDTVRALMSEDQGLFLRGIIAHSLGAAAVVNALAKDGNALTTVCIAPVLRLQELVLRTFDRIGIPKQIYTALIGEFEARYGYNLEADNPYRLLDRVAGPVLIVHDALDRTTDFEDSKEQARNHHHISLYATNGLGHSGLLTDERTIGRCVTFIGQMA